MAMRIWEDQAAMNIVSVLGFLMNDEGDVVGAERTQVLCKLMPSIHTIAHRAILGMLITGLNDTDAQLFYAESGLIVLNDWLSDSLQRKETGLTKQKRVAAMYSQVRALLRLLDVNVQTDATRKQNAYLCKTLPKLINYLDGAGPEFAAERSRINIYRRHFESACGVESTVNESRASAPIPATKPTTVHSTSYFVPSSQLASTPSASTGTTTPTSSSFSSSSTSSFSTSSSSSSTPTARISPSSLLEYQAKDFLQVDVPARDEDMGEFLDDDEESVGMGEHLVTNVTQTALNASLDQKIRSLGHVMHYSDRQPCRNCNRMGAKRCERCMNCPKCVQKGQCNPSSMTPGAPKPASVLSVSDRNAQVLGSAMDQAIYKAFKMQDFHSVFSLVQNGMNVNFQRIESDRSTALMAAAHHGREDAVNKLLSLGANPALVDVNGDAAWAFAKRHGHIELMERLKRAAEEGK